MMPAYELSDSNRKEIASAAKAQMRRHDGGTAESEVAFKKFSAIYLEMLADPVPTAQDLYRYLVDEVNVQRAFDARLTYHAALSIAMHKAIDKFGLTVSPPNDNQGTPEGEEV